MGLEVAELKLIIRLRQAGYLAGRPSIAEIGAQQISNHALRATDVFNEMLSLFGSHRQLDLPVPPPPVSEIEPLPADAPFARDFWTCIGSRYAAIDIDGSPDSIPLDLNYDSVPDELIGQFDLVTNLGTTEHIANQLNAFKVIHDLTAPGGIMIHHVPGYGMVNHGLVTYNPKFFWTLARSNGYGYLYMNYTISNNPSEFPADIIDSVSKFEPHYRHLAHCEIHDGSILTAFQKVYDIAYVPPIDVATGTLPASEKLRQRYWTVFEPEAFSKAPDRNDTLHPDTVPEVI